MSYSDIIEILETSLNNEEIGLNQGIELLKSNELNLIGAAADILRKKDCGDTVTFVVDRNINYTNICSSKCKFCAFYRDENKDDSYVLTIDEIITKISEAVKLGATQILIQGGLNPELPIEYYENMLKEIKKRFDVQIHGFSPPEIIHISKLYGASIKETISRLHDSGLDSIPGGGAEILNNNVRAKISPNKIKWEEWKDVMLKAHGLGIPTTATMMFGHVETLKERIEHIIKIREIQKKYHGFTAFIPWSFQQGNTQIKGCSTGVEYLKTLAISRILLNGYIQNIQTSWVTQGLNMAQIGLNYGANDLGGTMIEENVVSATGLAFHRKNIDEFVYVAKKLGRPVAKRDTLYNIIENIY